MRCLGEIAQSPPIALFGLPFSNRDIMQNDRFQNLVFHITAFHILLDAADFLLFGTGCHESSQVVLVQGQRQFAQKIKFICETASCAR